MYENNRKNIFSTELEYISISLISNKTKVLIIGGGKAGFIKCRTFIKKGCNVCVVSQNFVEEFEGIKDYKNLIMVNGSYSHDLILDKHLIIIAVSEDSLRQSIINDCEKNYKLYLNCTDFTKGSFITPVQRETKNVSFCVHTKRGNPKASLYLSSILGERIKENDEFIGYLCDLREIYKNHINKNEIMNFTASEDFKFFFDKGFAESVLKMFYDV